MPEPADDRQAYAVDDPRPGPLQVVDEQRERNVVTERLSMPSCASRVVNVAAISANGAPEETPTKNAARGAASVYCRSGSKAASYASPKTPSRAPTRSRSLAARDPRTAGACRWPPCVIAAPERGAHDLIVDAPTRVVGPRLAAIRPPRVLVRLLVHGAERVDETAAGEQRIEPSALGGREARVVLQRSPVLQVDRPVSHVEVAAEHERQADCVASSRRRRSNAARKRNFASCRAGLDEPDGKYALTTATPRTAPRHSALRDRTLARRCRARRPSARRASRSRRRCSRAARRARTRGDNRARETPRRRFAASCALSSCTQSTSARCRANHAKETLARCTAQPVRVEGDNSQENRPVGKRKRYDTRRLTDPTTDERV